MWLHKFHHSSLGRIFVSLLYYFVYFISFIFVFFIDCLSWWLCSSHPHSWWSHSLLCNRLSTHFHAGYQQDCVFIINHSFSFDHQVLSLSDFIIICSLSLWITVFLLSSFLTIARFIYPVEFLFIVLILD